VHHLVLPGERPSTSDPAKVVGRAYFSRNQISLFPLCHHCRKVTDFVRRRRWVRTQRPIADADREGGSTHAGGDGDACGASPHHGSPPGRPGQLLEALSFPKPLVICPLSRH